MKANMKKAVASALSALVLAGMAMLLINNKKNVMQQSISVSENERTVNVSTAKVERSFISDGFTSGGVTLAQKELTLYPDIAGRVVEIYTDKGERVLKGSPLLKLDDELLRADYLAAKASCEALERDERRLANANEEGGVSRQQLDNVRTQLSAARSRLTVAGRRYEDAVVRSPIDGTVNLRFAEVGSLVSLNSPLFEIVDESRVKIICYVPEDKVKLLSVGQRITAMASDGAECFGRVGHIGIKSDKSLNYPVEVAFERGQEVRIGIYMKVRFCDGCGHDGVLVPRKAVIGSARSAMAYVVEDGKARSRVLRLGKMFGASVEVLEGLREGEQMIVSGLMNVAEGSEVKIVNGAGL